MTAILPSDEAGTPAGSSRPERALTRASWLFASLFCRLVVHGRENLPPTGEPVIYVANHVTFLDPVIVRAALGRTVHFAIDPFMASLWWVKLFSRFVPLAPVEPVRPFGIRTLLRTLRAGRSVIVFPEGRLTMTGGLMHVYEGAGFLAARTGARIVPVRIDGMEHSFLTRMSGAQRRRHLRPAAAITIGAPTRLPPDGRKAATDRVVRLLDRPPVSGPVARLGDAIRERARANGLGRPALRDGTGASWTYREVLAEALRATGDAPPARPVAVPAGRGVPALLRIVGLWLRDAVPALHAPGELPPPLPEDLPAQAALLVASEGGWRVVTAETVLGETARLAHLRPLDGTDRLVQPLHWSDADILASGFLWPWFAGAPLLAYGRPLAPRLLNDAAYIANATILLADNRLARACRAAAHPFVFKTLRAMLRPDGTEIA